MEAVFTYTADQLPEACAWAGTQTSSWGLPIAHVSRWLAQAAQELADSETGKAVLCYEPEDRLLSFDVWSGGRRVFGMDDFL